MPLLYATYKEEIKPLVEKLPEEKLLFAAVWTADYLDRQYGIYFNHIGHKEERDVLQNAIAFLWNVVDDAAAINLTEQRRHLKLVRNIDIDNLDFAIPDQCGILKIMEATESALVFVKNKNVNNVVDIGWHPIEVLNSVKDSVIPWYETPPNYEIDDPFFKEELTAQMRLYSFLNSNEPVSSAEKKIFRL
ncbi:hypothetical protein [Filimonas effusa]|uniref:DUF416 family protein n=1 Tax=Filimonas effusa TaxID=2508721 RepID=A0A4Q1D0H0_9BACT|nr:hypothetical protein [Filimonas effusa]RXK81152.1 hypothetical protein ESB13_19620 [Filimonas effusa]